MMIMMTLLLWSLQTVWAPHSTPHHCPKQISESNCGNLWTKKVSKATLLLPPFHENDPSNWTFFVMDHGQEYFKGNEKKFVFDYLRKLSSPRQPSSEISVRGMWKASDHENSLREVAVGVPHLKESFNSLQPTFFSWGKSNSFFCSLLISPKSSWLIPWLSTWKKPHSVDAFAIAALQARLSFSLAGPIKDLRSIIGSWHSPET